MMKLAHKSSAFFEILLLCASYLFYTFFLKKDFLLHKITQLYIFVSMNM